MTTPAQLSAVLAVPDRPRIWGPSGAFSGNFLPAAAILFLLGGASAWLYAPTRELAGSLSAIGLVVTGAPVVWRTTRSMLQEAIDVAVIVNALRASR